MNDPCVSASDTSKSTFQKQVGTTSATIPKRRSIDLTQKGKLKLTSHNFVSVYYGPPTQEKNIDKFIDSHRNVLGSFSELLFNVWLFAHVISRKIASKHFRGLSNNDVNRDRKPIWSIIPVRSRYESNVFLMRLCNDDVQTEGKGVWKWGKGETRERGCHNRC